MAKPGHPRHHAGAVSLGVAASELRTVDPLGAWVSDVEAIDNTARSFSAVRPEWPAASIRLSEVIRVLAGRVGRLCVVVRDVEHNSQFIRTLRDLQLATDGRLGLAIAPTAHEKTIVGEDYIFGGSMNLTRSGLIS